MGYTHYWQRTDEPTPDEAFGRTLLDTKAIIKTAGEQGIAIAGWDGEGEPELTEGLIRFNGVAPDEDYETFVFTPTHRDFEFCKTSCVRPYDAVVCAVLIAAKHHYGGALRVNSDGEWDAEDEWMRGRALYEAATGRPAGDASIITPLVHA
jgi:hypothetical protein